MKRSIALGKLSRFVDGIVEGRDPSLAEHHHRTSRAARQFGRHLGMGRGKIRLLEIALALHDFGKLSIPDSILHKPARLSSAEFSMVQQHPEFGHRMIEPLGLDPAINEIVLHHHENYDGTGYPAGLKGDGIPYFARVARILDSFDALTEDRPYHRGVPPEDALGILQRDERMYDPMLLATFSQAIVDFGSGN